MKISWYGTASLKIEAESPEYGHSQLLVDPFVPAPGSPVDITLEDYRGIDDVIITHGHLDHIASLPRMVTAGNRIFCTKTPALSLQEKGIDPNCLKVIEPGDKLQIGGISITAYQGKHVKFDGALIRRTLVNLDTLRHFGNLIALFKEHTKDRENGETLGYSVEAEGKSIFILGSIGLDDAVDYPSQMDLLVLPFQGSSHLMEIAQGIIDKLQPKAIMLDHFDNTFPPLSTAIDTSEFTAKYSDALPIIVPDYRRSYEI